MISGSYDNILLLKNTLCHKIIYEIKVVVFKWQHSFTEKSIVSICERKIVLSRVYLVQIRLFWFVVNMGATKAMEYLCSFVFIKYLTHASRAIWYLFFSSFYFLLFTLALRARANNYENKMTRKINLILSSQPCVNWYISNS